MTTESGQPSGSKPSDDVWAKLVPLDTRFSDIEIRCNDVVICSEIKSSSVEKYEWCRITRNLDQQSATIQNRSLDAIVVDESTVLKDGAVEIRCGSEIVPGPGREGYLRYRFTTMPGLESRNQLLKISIDPEHAKCSICLNIWHDVVTAAPCLHNFCNGCFSEWLRRSKEKHSKVLCPQCRAVVQFVGRNHFLNNIRKDILEADPSLKRPDDEIAVLESSASIRSNLIIQNERKQRQKRPLSPAREEMENGQCPQCVNSIGGYHCDPNTVHLQCQLCGGMMPSRTNLQVPQHCMGCDRSFCGAYWRLQGVIHGDLPAICRPEAFKPISEHTITGIPFITHEMNRHEQDITLRCIDRMGRTVQDVVAEWVRKLNNREIDRTRMPLNHAEMITSATHVCSDCYNKLVSFLLYWFRISTPRHCLPADAAQREDCWYGHTCRTQHHNEEHARKRNHVCRPTRGSQP
ncbi:PREDICTED: E3 ubiquitin-protein ligase CHFR [Tarenaya hassleriana]|uniref:E3 ubiquitin-protein ligase CHFR n=1 Tax=Tarenaya hassleriana TaxID=28532 RepID=UPI00053C3219|nr:PREDICTED: E3 ubiquitin-protein ligase CHFR [Tarenaya hassleriana]